MVDAALWRLRERNEDRFKVIDDAWAVQAELERRQSKLLRDHSDWLVDHQKAIADHSAELKLDRRFIAKHRRNMLEIEHKLNALISREMKRDGL